MEILALDESSWATADWPLGAHPHRDGVTFAVYAPDATRIGLEIYDRALGADAIATYLPARGEDGVWRARLQGLQLGTLYAYRAWGANWDYDEEWEPGSDAGFVSDLDETGNRFNPNKALFDPYARELSHTVYTDELADYGVDDGVFGTGGDDYHGAPRRQADTGRYVPKGIIVAEPLPRQPRLGLPPQDAAIYEVQTQQLSGHPSTARLTELLAGEPGFDELVDVPEEYRGTYRGAGLMAPYLKGLGFNTVELLPVHETNSSQSARSGKTNSWGYMTLGFFAPNRRYSSDRSPGGPTREFREMVDAFHEHGIEVYLDVVYNHTAEGGNWNGDVNTTGFTSLGGFATAKYYSMTSGRMLVDGATGTSNQLNYSSGAARKLVMDSLEYWTTDMHVDGFRFDLATVLGRLPGDADPDDWDGQKRFFQDHPLLVEIADFAEQRGVEVIAEAWDLWGYEVGNFPRGWGEWNGRYRDAVRRFTKGDGNVGSFLDQFNGDYHHFADNGGAQKTINFIDAHDGFNLVDLVSYQTKQNGQPYPFGPSDGGSDDNLSWDSGGSAELRRQRVRNLWTLLFLSRGVPMVVAGDEFGRTQNGNNNPWALDSIAMRNNYEMIPTNAPNRVSVGTPGEARYHDNLGEFENAETVNGLFRFSRFMVGLRARHEALRQVQWGDLVADNADVSYLFRTPSGIASPREGDRALGVLINSPGDDFWVMINMADVPVDFTAPALPAGRAWRWLIDTSTAHESHFNHWLEDDGDLAGRYATVAPWSVAVWHETVAPKPPAGSRSADATPDRARAHWRRLKRDAVPRHAQR